MFADPVVATIAGESRTLPRILLSGQSSFYREPDEGVSFKVSHQTNKNRTRRLLRFDVMAPGTDPLTSQATTKNVALYLVVDEPASAVFTDSNDIVAGLVGELCTFLTANTAANTLKFLGSEI